MDAATGHVILSKTISSNAFMQTSHTWEKIQNVSKITEIVNYPLDKAEEQAYNAHNKSKDGDTVERGQTSFREFPVGVRGMAAWLEISSPELSEERPAGQVERYRDLPLQREGVVGHPVRPLSVRGR